MWSFAELLVHARVCDPSEVGVGCLGRGGGGAAVPELQGGHDRRTRQHGQPLQKRLRGTVGHGLRNVIVQQEDNLFIRLSEDEYVHTSEMTPRDCWSRSAQGTTMLSYYSVMFHLLFTILWGISNYLIILHRQPLQKRLGGTVGYGLRKEPPCPFIICITKFEFDLMLYFINHISNY